MGTILASFKHLGKMPEQKEKFIASVNIVRALSGNFKSIFTEIPSKPGALLGLISERTFLSSCIVTGLKKNEF